MYDVQECFPLRGFSVMIKFPSVTTTCNILCVCVGGVGCVYVSICMPRRNIKNKKEQYQIHVYVDTCVHIYNVFR